MAKTANAIRAQCDASARYIASKENWLWRTRTKNKIRQINEPTRSNKPKKRPLDAPTQSTRPEWAWAIATARRDSITSKRCSRSSSVYLYANNKFSLYEQVYGNIKHTLDDVQCASTSHKWPQHQLVNIQWWTGINKVLNLAQSFPWCWPDHN